MSDITTSTVMELVSGYETYANVAEMHLEAAVDAPATSPFCAGAAISAVVSAVGSATASHGC